MAGVQAPAPPHIHDGRFAWRQVLWRGLAFLTVFAAGFCGLMLDVGVSERDVTGASAATRAYYTLGLFVLGGLDLGTPQGGPPLGRALLWASYFLAPVITASALLEAALRIIAPLTLRARRLKGHVVVAGGGRLALLYLKKLREDDRRTPVLVVERNPLHPHMSELQDVYRAIVVTGDITSNAVLHRLRVQRARQVMLLTGDDFTNLDAAAKILTLAPQLRHHIVSHVSDLQFMRAVASTNVAQECETFNGHEFAAVRLVNEHLLARFASTDYRDPVVLAGFGRFGQTVLHQLQQYAFGSFGTVVIVDFDASERARAFEEYPGFSADYDRHVIDADLRDPQVWSRIGEIVSADGREPVIIVGAGDDRTNLDTALTLIKKYPGAYIIARSFRQSPFADEVSSDVGIHPFNIGDLIAEGMPGRWFGEPADRSARAASNGPVPSP